MRRRRRRKRPGKGWFGILYAFAKADEADRGRLPDLSVGEILSWADAYHARSGRWPIYRSGEIPESPGETWMAVEAALSFGLRGLRRGSTLARLLAERRGKRNRMALPPFTVRQILVWADAHYRTFHEWPTCKSGPIRQAPGESWNAVQVALCLGTRGLPGGSSLAQLLAETRSKRNHMRLEPLTRAKILRWADRYFRCHGRWPTARSGPVADEPGETWQAIDAALLEGHRGLSGGSSVARLVADGRGIRNLTNCPRLTEKAILGWTRSYFQRHGRWPTALSGSIGEAPGETWAAVQCALQVGRRGLPGGSSLARLLAKKYGKRNKQDLPCLTQRLILSWADQHFRRTGDWPRARSGPVAGAPGETWACVDAALSRGGRGLAGGATLAHLLFQERGARMQPYRPKLTRTGILAWARAHFRRTGQWPTQNSGPVTDAPGETWGAVDAALTAGSRGLPGGTSLVKLLAKHCGRRNRGDLPRLTVTLILSWAVKHQRRTGRWPGWESGAVLDSPGENWGAIQQALAGGFRGLPGGTSLARLLAKRKG